MLPVKTESLCTVKLTDGLAANYIRNESVSSESRINLISLVQNLFPVAETPPPTLPAEGIVPCRSECYYPDLPLPFTPELCAKAVSILVC